MGTWYPGSDPKRLPISGIDKANQENSVKVYHAGTKLAEGGLQTSGGRVLAVTGLGQDFKEALTRAYAGVSNISFEPASGLHFRRDIGHRALRQLGEVQ